MITDNPARLQAAQARLLQFIQAGRVGDAKAQIALQHSPAGWPVSRDDLARQIKQRLDGALPKQLETSYCGPAAFLACLLHDRPDIYVAYVVSLWQQGRFGFHTGSTGVMTDSGHGEMPAAAKLVTTRAADHKHQHINDVDWMTMACLSASTRPFSFGTLTPDDKAGSVTYPLVLRHWFMAAGAQVRDSTMGAGLLASGLVDTLGLLRYWSTSWIVLQIDVSLLQAGEVDFLGGRHWVVVDPHHHPLAYRQPGNVPMPFAAAIGEIMKVLAQRFNEGVKAAGGLAKMDDAAAAKLQDQAIDALSGTPVAEWTTNLRLTSWAEESDGIYTGKLGRLIRRIYGGYAFSRFK